ncbi:MAG: hypothetical protein AAFY78_14835 [Cyanobacteria bacterium J06648_16]
MTESTAHRLTDIEGIGTAKQNWLNELGIYTISELANSKVVSLTNQLVEKGHSAAQSEVQQWIAQARTLPTTEEQSIEQSDTEEWRDATTFSVACQTRKKNDQPQQRIQIKHVDTQVTQTLEISSAVNLFAWIAELMQATQSQIASEESSSQQYENNTKSHQAEDTRTIEEKEVKSAEAIAEIETDVQVLPIPAAETPIQVSIDQVSFLQASRRELTIPSNLPSDTIGSIQADVPFRVEAIVRLINLKEFPALKGMRPKLRLDLTFSSKTKTSHSFSSSMSSMSQVCSLPTIPLNENQFSVLVTLSDQTLEMGIYQVEVLAHIDEISVVPGFLKVPALQVQ